MSDETERPEDALRRIAGKCMELEQWKAKYREAAELWEALELTNNQQVIGGVLLAKVKDFDDGVVSMSMSNTDDVDWVDQIGIMRVCTLIMENSPIERDDG